MYGYLDRGNSKKMLGMYLGQALLCGTYSALFIFTFALCLVVFPDRMYVVFIVIFLEWVCFVSYKVAIGEMWHPGVVTQHSTYNDYFVGMVDKIPMYFYCLVLSSIPSRDPRRVSPHVW